MADLTSVIEVSSVVTALAAVAAVIVAFWQLRRIAREQHSTAKTNEAEFLLHIDQMYEGGAFDTARKSFSKLKTACWRHLTEIYDQDSLRNGKSNRIYFSYLFSLCLREMSKEGQYRPDYAELIKFIGFFETMGFFVNHGLVGRALIFSLYDSLLWQVYELFRPHIMERREDPQLLNPRFMKNFEYVAKDAHRHLYGAHDVNARCWGEELQTLYTQFCDVCVADAHKIIKECFDGQVDNKLTTGRA